ncbi:MAG: serine/threonine protein kinase [Christensenellales bacterium]|jgi:hypothetical protein
MDYTKICYGCFKEKEGSFCPWCGFGEGNYEHPYLALPLGTILNGKYLTGKVLGAGGFGVTYLAYDIVLEMKVAIKEYMPQGIATRMADRYTATVVSAADRATYDKGADKFLDEARILARVKDVPHIVTVYEYFRENGTAYFVMDFVEGTSLKSVMEKEGGKVSYETALRCLLPVMAAMDRVHAQNLLHRDISPDNIFVTKTGEGMLLDFGAARFAVRDEQSLSVILKHGYAPEEQYRSRGKQGPWTDVYAMAATMYHAITGMMPPDAIERVHQDTYVSPAAMGVALPAAADAAITKALAVSADNRLQSMKAFADALRGNTVHTRPATAYVPPAPAATAGSYTPVVPPAAPAAPAGGTYAGRPKKSLKDRPGLLAGIILGGAAALLTMVLGIVLLVKLGNTGTGPVLSGGSSGGEPITLAPKQPVQDETIAPVLTPDPTEEPAVVFVDESFSEYTCGSLGCTIEFPDRWASGVGVYSSGFEMFDTGDYDNYTTYMDVSYWAHLNDTPLYSLEDMNDDVFVRMAEYYRSNYLASGPLNNLDYGIGEAGTWDRPYAYITFTTTVRGQSVRVYIVFCESLNNYGLYGILSCCVQGENEDLYMALMERATLSFKAVSSFEDKDTMLLDRSYDLRFKALLNRACVDRVDTAGLNNGIAMYTNSGNTSYVTVFYMPKGHEFTADAYYDALDGSLVDSGATVKEERYTYNTGDYRMAYEVKEYEYTASGTHMSATSLFYYNGAFSFAILMESDDEGLEDAQNLLNYVVATFTVVE